MLVSGHLPGPAIIILVAPSTTRRIVIKTRTIQTQDSWTIGTYYVYMIILLMIMQHYLQNIPY